MNQYTGQGHVVASRPVGPQLLTHKRKPGKRGVVSGYSKASRRRLKYMLARLERSSALFATITQRDIISLDDYRRHWRAFDVALRRRYPRVGLVVWRVEMQQRGARHLHLIIRPKPGVKKLYIPWRWISATWGRLVGQGTVREDGWVEGTPSVEVRYVAPGSPRLMAYVAKYVSKQASGDGSEASEASGASEQDADSLDNSIITAQSVGRAWGLTGRMWAVNAPIRIVNPSDLTPRSLDYLQKLADWRREQGYTVIAWSAIVWDRLT